MAYIFNYMGPNPAHAKIIEKAWPSGGSTGWKRVQSIGPSPVLLHKKDLERIAKPWEETAVHLKTDPEADGRLGWVIVLSRPFNFAGQCEILPLLMHRRHQQHMPRLRLPLQSAVCYCED